MKQGTFCQVNMVYSWLHLQYPFEFGRLFICVIKQLYYILFGIAERTSKKKARTITDKENFETYLLPLSCVNRLYCSTISCHTKALKLTKRKCQTI